jgi:DNA-binding CsgD family transcriptional regulator
LFVVFVAVGGMCLLWYKRTILAIPDSERTAFILACAAGFAVIAALLDFAPLRLGAREFALGCIGAAIGCTALMGGPGPVHRVALVLAGVCVGAAFFRIQLAGLRALPPQWRASAFAGVFIGAGAVNTTTDLSELPWARVQGSGANLVLGCVSLGVAAAVLAWGGRVLNVRFVPITEAALTSGRRVVGIGLLAAGSLVLLYAALAMRGESVVYPVAITQLSSSGFVRYAELPLFAAAGWAADRHGRQSLVVISLVAALVGATGALAAGSAALVGVAALAKVVATIAYPVACCALIADAACYSRRPALLGCMAFAPVLAGQLVEALARPAVAGLSGTDLFLVELAVLGVFSAVAVALLEMIRVDFARLGEAVAVVEVDEAASGQIDLDAFGSEHGLTGREREILSLSMDGMTVPQMASHLFVTETTIKFHVGNLLKKTGTSSRAELTRTLTADPDDLDAAGVDPPPVR